MKKKLVMILLTLSVVMGQMTGCGQTEGSLSENSSSETKNSTVTGQVSEYTSENVIDMDFTLVSKELKDADTTTSAQDGIAIQLEKDSVSYEGSGVSFANGVLTISKGGTYVLSGELEGRVVVDASDEKVFLILNGATIEAADYAAIYVSSADKVVITLQDGTNNVVSDGSTYVLQGDDDNCDAVIFSKADLTLNGTGSLKVIGNYDNGIVSKDDLKIVSGTYDISALNNGIKGKDSVAIYDGTFDISVGGNAVKSDNEESTEENLLGFVYVENGTFTISSGEDGFEAESVVRILSGTYQISSTGKGIKATTGIQLEGGNYVIDSEDDCIHCNGDVVIVDGTFTLSSLDDGVHADDTLQILDGVILIEDSYEGLEASLIDIDGGDITLYASDDGLNAAGGTDSMESENQRMRDPFSTSTGTIDISGGTIVVNSKGDGVDSNGAIYQSGGSIYVSGPTDSGNGALDYDSEYVMTGGSLVACGSTGMLQSISNTSSVNCIVVYGSYEAGSEIRVLKEDGTEILSYTPEKSYESAVIASDLIAEGEQVTIEIGGETIETVTIESQSTTVGTATGGMGGFGGHGGMKGNMDGTFEGDGTMRERPDGAFEGTENMQGGSEGMMGPQGGNFEGKEGMQMPQDGNFEGMEGRPGGNFEGKEENNQ